MAATGTLDEKQERAIGGRLLRRRHEVMVCAGLRQLVADTSGKGGYAHASDAQNASGAARVHNHLWRLSLCWRFARWHKRASCQLSICGDPRGGSLYASHHVRIVADRKSTRLNSS